MGQFMKRQKASEYMLIVVASFVLTELAIRLFLHITGYPQIAFWNLHIAHVLWGGLFLFAATTILLVFSNPSAYVWSAVLAGMGGSLFIDEIGKFITKNNDYFFQGALPLIYVSFLLIFLLYIYANKPRKLTTSELFYDVLDDCKDILHSDLDPAEKERIEHKLSEISEKSDNKSVRGFASTLLGYIKGIEHKKELKKNPFFERLKKLRDKIKAKTFLKRLFLFALLVLLVFNSINMISEGILLGVEVLQASGEFFPAAHEFVKANFPSIMPLNLNVIMISIQSMLQFFVGAMIIMGIGFLLLRKNRGIKIAKFALVFSLCSTDIILIYYYQFAQFIPILLKLLTLGLITAYEKLYLAADTKSIVDDGKTSKPKK